MLRIENTDLARELVKPHELRLSTIYSADHFHPGIE